MKTTTMLSASHALLDRFKMKNRWLILPALFSTFVFSACKKQDAQSLATSKDGTISKNFATQSLASNIAIPSLSDSQLGLDCFNNTWFNNYGSYGSSYKAYYYGDQMRTAQQSFWITAEETETQIDAYNVNPTQANKNNIQYLYNGFIDQHTTDWSSNSYNDDIMWASIMAERAYEITHDNTQLTVAKNNFDMVWNRAYSTDFGGGLWWSTANTSKNACVNGPAAICAMLLYKATGDTTYRHKAKIVMDWLVNTLYVPGTGQVIDHIDNAGPAGGALSYNQGTFIGAADLLMPYYPASNYLNMAKQAMNYTKNSMCNTAGGYLNAETGTGDCYGMKSIFARWACLFVKDSGDIADYGDWLDYNAATAWSIRNNSGLMWMYWNTRTLDLPLLNSWTCNGGVSMILNVHRYH